MRTMLAGRLHLDIRTFAVEEVAIPVPGPGEVLVEVRGAGVCLSDVHLIDGSLTPHFPVDEVVRSRAVTLGHEVAGVVHTLGPDLMGDWAPGMRVALQAGQACGQCDDCMRRSSCRMPLTRGVDYDGGWAEFAIAREDTLAPIPDHMPFDEAAIIPDAVSTPYAAIVETGAVRPAQAVGIWGAGGLGAHGIRLARLAGATPSSPSTRCRKPASAPSPSVPTSRSTLPRRTSPLLWTWPLVAVAWTSPSTSPVSPSFGSRPRPSWAPAGCWYWLDSPRSPSPSPTAQGSASAATRSVATTAPDPNT